MKKSKSFSTANGGGGPSSSPSISGGKRPVVIKTFSAQFPPPELLELSNPIYTALIKKPASSSTSGSSTPVHLLPPQPTRPAPSSPPNSVTTSKSPSPQVVAVNNNKQVKLKLNLTLSKTKLYW